ncbi:DGQHR domain-containing protein [Pseudomonas viridiflava]|uniref:DGQHR domain-containing protein n=1 Tax=Pseudomonas viridiflava TaxID=33069 RepID=UPI000F03833C|nr:DGQHR domain-containing protein [Pseudomonas viridiflava]
MNVIKGSCIRVSQPIGDFYCSVFKARDLYDISYSDVRRLEDEQDGEGLDTYLGIQRELSPFRVKQIGEYITAVDATFPNSIIVAIGEKYVTLEGNVLSIKYHDDQKGNVAKILDGQHRLAGFEGTDFCYSSPSGERKDFELLVTIFVEADLHTQAQVFTMVNQNQTKVNRSLVYDLESLALARSPTKSAHQIVSLLNGQKGSPFYQRIKRLGLKTPGVSTELITQAAFVENLVKLISKKPSLDRDILLGRKKKFFGMKDKKLPDMEDADFVRLPFRKNFADGDDSVIAANVYNYFSAASKVWPESWRVENKSSALNKTVGLIALMRALRDAYNKAVKAGVAEYGDVIDESEYIKILSRSGIKDSFFSELDAVSKTSGLIYKAIQPPKAKFYSVEFSDGSGGRNKAIVPARSKDVIASNFVGNIIAVSESFWVELEEVAFESSYPVFHFKLENKDIAFRREDLGYSYLSYIYRSLLVGASFDD